MINLRTDVNDLEWDEIYPGVICYRNMLKDPTKAYETMRKSEELASGDYYLSAWTPWSAFGTYSQPKDGNSLTNVLEQQFKDEKDLDEEIRTAYDKAISHYFNNISIERTLPEDAYFSGHSYCKYFNDVDVLKNKMTMQYHTDFIVSEKDMPGPKFHTTCTFYINDNYDGGDVEFWVNGDVTNHKPKAGDLMVFPSGEPFYHGVKTIPTGNKFFVRNFVMHSYEGSPEWIANQRKYGAYKWAKMENERIEFDNKRTMIYFKDGKPVSYEEAYPQDAGAM
jgi:hypothetical protein